MKIVNYVFFVLGVMVLFGCQKRELSSSEKDWNPYELNQEITFQSDDGEEINLTISKIELKKTKTNVYAGNLSKKKENLTVFATDMADGEEHVLLVVFKDSDGEGNVNFTLNLPNILDVNHVELIDDLEDDLAPYMGYDDVVNINPIANVSPDVTTPYVVNFDFSKSKGYLRYELDGGAIWMLK